MRKFCIAIGDFNHYPFLLRNASRLNPWPIISHHLLLGQILHRYNLSFSDQFLVWLQQHNTTGQNTVMLYRYSTDQQVQLSHPSYITVTRCIPVSLNTISPNFHLFKMLLQYYSKNPIFGFHTGYLYILELGLTPIYITDLFTYEPECNLRSSNTVNYS